MTKKPEFVLGHDIPPKRFNVRKEIRRIRHDPLRPFLVTLDSNSSSLFTNEFSMYEEAYRFYFLSLSRFLKEMSIASRWSRGPYYIRKYGGKYTPNQRALAEKYNKIAPFVDLDFFTCLIQARILLDHTVAISRTFLSGRHLPSFMSFAKHKKFFQKLHEPYGQFEDYAHYFRKETEWFDVPIKVVRDKFLVHAGPKHMKSFGYPMGSDHLDLDIILPDQKRLLAEVKMIHVNILQMSYDIERFLRWFCDYAQGYVRK